MASYLCYLNHEGENINYSCVWVSPELYSTNQQDNE
jgi:hypothetical protein